MLNQLKLGVKSTRNLVLIFNTLDSVISTLTSVDAYTHFASVKINTVGVNLTMVILLCTLAALLPVITFISAITLYSIL